MAAVVATAGTAVTTTTTTATITQPSTEQVTTTVQQTTTAPPTTVVTTATVAPPTTAPATTATESTSSGTPTWVWVLLGLLGASLIGLLIYLFTRGGPAPAALPEAERRSRLQGAIDSWTTQGWALLSESAETAVLQRGNERMTVTVDPAGHINTHAVTPEPPDQPPDRWPE
jgi:hypothetical protein